MKRVDAARLSGHFSAQFSEIAFGKTVDGEINGLPTTTARVAIVSQLEVHVYSLTVKELDGKIVHEETRALATIADTATQPFLRHAMTVKSSENSQNYFDHHIALEFISTGGKSDNLLVVGSVQACGMLFVIETETWKIVKTLSLSRRLPLPVEKDDDNNNNAVVNDDGLGYMHVRYESRVGRWPTPLAVSPCGCFMATIGQGTNELLVFDTTTWELVGGAPALLPEPLRHCDGENGVRIVTALCFSPDSRTLFALSFGNIFMFARSSNSNSSNQQHAGFSLTSTHYHGVVNNVDSYTSAAAAVSAISAVVRVPGQLPIKMWFCNSSEYIIQYAQVSPWQPLDYQWKCAMGNQVFHVRDAMSGIRIPTQTSAFLTQSPNGGGGGPCCPIAGTSSFLCLTDKGEELGNADNVVLSECALLRVASSSADPAADPPSRLRGSLNLAKIAEASSVEWLSGKFRVNLAGASSPAAVATTDSGHGRTAFVGVVGRQRFGMNAWLHMNALLVVKEDPQL